jgi:NADH-quinone oxidoreductase subunit C
MLGPDVLSCSIEYNELTFQVFPASIIRVLTLLRDNADCRFKVLIDICGADYPDRPQRFDVVYHLLSVHLNQRIRVKLMVDEVTPVPSVVGIYSCANWYEREAWDMYGILFSDHPDLRRILTDYNFDGYPMRKDFPLTGYWEVRYDEESKRVTYDPVSLQQDFRTFDFVSPWEGAVRERVSNQVKRSASIDEKKAS